LVEELELDQVRALSIETMRQRSYPGSDVTIERTLTPGVNYNRYIASYQSDGLQIFALLTVPTAPRPLTGWPVIVFNHGYIPPALYSPTERYEAYVDALARNGYMVFRPDYRGHGNSEGDARGAYGSPAYTIDVLNAVASVKRHPAADPERIGMWGHSMGGHIALRSMVITDDIRAGVIWAGVVASYADMFTLLDIANIPIPERAQAWRTQLIAEFGTPAQNPEFWDSISAHSYLNDLSGPLQLHHGTGDPAVPFLFSLLLQQQLQAAGQTSAYFAYSGDDHNISVNFTTAMERSLDFFDRHVKYGAGN
jgi:dipeptidyl aminopeptidase/acylaminoacyl peptidase